MEKLVAVFVIAFGFSTAQAGQVTDLDLEPCINGGVSASGTYPTQEMEELTHAFQDGSEFGSLAYEPCVNGEVSSSGRYPTQMMEDILERSTASIR